MATLKKPNKPCGWCGRPTTATDRVCPACVITDRHADDVPSWQDALYGGTWTVIPGSGGIQRWTPWGAA